MKIKKHKTLVERVTELEEKDRLKDAKIEELKEKLEKALKK